MTKGEYGYLNSTKKKNLISTIIMFFIFLVIMLIGYILNDFSNRNIFTVIAVLFILPGTRSLIGFITLIPYKTSDIKLYDEIDKSKLANDILYSDLVVSSPERVMGLSFLVIREDSILGLNNKDQKNGKDIRAYLEALLKARELDYKVKIYHSYDGFLEKVKEVNEHKDNHVKSRDELLEVQELIRMILI